MRAIQIVDVCIVIKLLNGVSKESARATRVYPIGFPGTNDALRIQHTFRQRLEAGSCQSTGTRAEAEVAGDPRST